MQRLEVSCAVRPICMSLGVKGLTLSAALWLGRRLIRNVYQVYLLGGGIKADGKYSWQLCHLHVPIVSKPWEPQPPGALRVCAIFTSLPWKQRPKWTVEFTLFRVKNKLFPWTNSVVMVFTLKHYRATDSCLFFQIISWQIPCCVSY